MLIINRHFGSTDDDADGDEAYCGSGGYQRNFVTACTTHEAGHEIFDDAPTYGTPYDDETEMAPVGTKSTHKLDATGTFDGWGYMSMYSTAAEDPGFGPGLESKRLMPLADTYAIPEALNPDYAVGFGDLTVHEQAADPTEPLTYSSYYAGGMRVFSFEGGKITPQGAFIDQDGNNFWGTEQFTTKDGERLIAGSDRDYGLYLFRYTGPLAAKRPACAESVAMVPFKGSAPVTLGCSDANAGNTLTKSLASQPKQGTAAMSGKDTATYTHTGSTLGEDSFTFKANDGAADSAPATAKVLIVPANGPRCFNPFAGTAARENIQGSPFGDRINAGGGNDNVDADEGADCVNGQAGNDQLLGNLGNDTIRGGSGRDRLFGDSGRDTLRGDSGNDHLRGSSGNDGLRGGSGRDRLDGGSNRDRVRGEKGNDRLYGGAGGDRLEGGSGRDRLEGGAGRDRFKSGSGNDRLFSDDNIEETINCGKGRDTVRADRKDKVSPNCETVIRSKKRK